tara:strand:- start:566 stop:1225 length:660 start_codon:yes stop_codon:yes gene_type:complete
MWQAAFNNELQKLAISIAPVKEALKRTRKQGIKLERVKTGPEGYPAAYGTASELETPTVFLQRSDRHVRQNPRRIFLHEVGHALDMPTVKIEKRKILERLRENEFPMLAHERAANTEARNIIRQTSKKPKADLREYDLEAGKSLQTHRIGAVSSRAFTPAPPNVALARRLERDIASFPDEYRHLRIMHNRLKKVSPEYKKSVQRISRKHKEELLRPHYY